MANSGWSAYNKGGWGVRFYVDTSGHVPLRHRSHVQGHGLLRDLQRVALLRREVRERHHRRELHRFSWSNTEAGQRQPDVERDAAPRLRCRLLHDVLRRRRFRLVERDRLRRYSRLQDLLRRYLGDARRPRRSRRTRRRTARARALRTTRIRPRRHPPRRRTLTLPCSAATRHLRDGLARRSAPTRGRTA